MRIARHPALGHLTARRIITFTVDGEPIAAREGDTIAAAMVDSGRLVTGYTRKNRKPRGVYCGIGRCCNCTMTVDGVPGVRTCQTLVTEGMRVLTAHGETEARIPERAEGSGGPGR